MFSRPMISIVYETSSITKSRDSGFNGQTEIILSGCSLRCLNYGRFKTYSRWLNVYTSGTVLSLRS